MKALVYNGPGKIAVEDRPEPKVEQPSDAVVKLTRTTICGTDLHIIKGDVPTVPNGRVLGHEGIGIVDSVGPDVKHFKKGDRVLIACITSCATCTFCRKSMLEMCKNGGWQLGHLIDGTQAEYVRIPFADNCLYSVPKGADERTLLCVYPISKPGYLLTAMEGPERHPTHGLRSWSSARWRQARLHSSHCWCWTSGTCSFVHGATILATEAGDVRPGRFETGSGEEDGCNPHNQPKRRTRCQRAGEGTFWRDRRLRCRDRGCRRARNV
jgi:NADPH:quinone reductase-like Zn-dependent oxidoreductase